MQRLVNFFLLFLCSLPSTTQAQTQPPVPSALIATALAKQVHLSSDLTLRQAMRSLSEQIGVEVQLADYLAERRLTANLDHVTARDALDALAELEDWQWIEDSPNRIRIERRPTLVPKETAFIPRLIQAELPRDLREFLKLPRPEDDPKKYSWAVLDGHPFLAGDMTNAMRLSAAQQLLALKGHLPALQGGVKFFIAGLTLQEQQHLLLGLTVRAMCQTGSVFWKGDLAPYMADPSTAILTFNSSDVLFVGTYIELQNGHTSAGIGTRVK